MSRGAALFVAALAGIAGILLGGAAWAAAGADIWVTGLALVCG